MAGGDRFASPGRTPMDKRNYQAAQNGRGSFLSKPPPAGTYANLKVGPHATIAYEANVAPPVDGSNAMARALSPFLIQVEPPLVFGTAPQFLDGKKNGPDVGIYGVASRGANGYYEARKNLSNSNYATANYGQANFNETVSTSTGEQHVAQTGSNIGTTRTPNTGEGPNRLGKPSIADLQTAIDIASQLKTILETPPLILLINPTNISISRTKVQQYTDRTRNGFVYHTWGQEQERLSITARCGAFISGGRGVQYASKRDSAAWQNLMAAFQFFRNNGYIHDTIGKSYAHHFVGALSIHYDQWSYFGNIESFGWSHDSSNENGGVSFTMEFVANKIVDNAQSSFVVTPMRAPTGSEQGVRYSSGGDYFDRTQGSTDAPGAQNYLPATVPGELINKVGTSPNLGVNGNGFQSAQDQQLDAALDAVLAQQPPEPFRVGAQ